MKSDAVYLQHVIDMIGRIEHATSVGESAFFESQIHQDAVLRNLHTMTETTQRVSTDLKAAHPEVEWSLLAAFRNVLVHDYLGIDLALVWTVVSRDVPALKRKILKIMREDP